VKSFRLSGIPRNEVELFLGEVENYLCLDHPHVTSLLDVYESDSHLHLVMECMSGGELFDRVVEKKRFSEEEARDAMKQMLLALNYLHSQGIAHRDVKLENFVYDRKGSDHLKLIDFGYSHRWDPNSQASMSRALGTAAYVAPEVRKGSYTSKCDMWSLGVVGYILLSGEMPFGGSEVEQLRKSGRGEFRMRPEKWNAVSADAQDFIRSLMEVEPSKRLSAQEALQHPWIARKESVDDGEGIVGVVEALRHFGQDSKLGQNCMRFMARSLPHEATAKVRDYFTSLDTTQQGTITFAELKNAMAKYLKTVEDVEVLQAFEALDYNHDGKIYYSDFLAAMLGRQIGLSESSLESAFHRLDEWNDCDSKITFSAAEFSAYFGVMVPSVVNQSGHPSWWSSKPARISAELVSALENAKGLLLMPWLNPH